MNYKLALLIIETRNHERGIKEIYWSLLFQKTALRETKSTLHHFWQRLEVRNIFLSLCFSALQSYFVRSSPVVVKYESNFSRLDNYSWNLEQNCGVGPPAIACIVFQR